MKHHAREVELGDIYAAATSASALREIDKAVEDAHARHIVGNTKPGPTSTPKALEDLRREGYKAKQTTNRCRAEAIGKSLDEIYRLTRAHHMELKRRRLEFLTSSLTCNNPIPDREALGRWLQSQADAAGDTRIERSYFSQLAQQLPSGRDPWSVSRELIRSLPSPGDAVQAAQLQIAHRRMVQATAGGLFEQPLEFDGPELPIRFRWLDTFRAVESRRQLDAVGLDIYAAAASAAALHEIGQAVMQTYIAHRMTGQNAGPCATQVAVKRLLGQRRNASSKGDQSRAEAIQRSLGHINRITYAHNTELELRSSEFRSASHLPGAPVVGRDALERWLRTQVDEARDAGIVRSYFMHLLQEFPGGRDPWTVSRELIRSLQGAGDPEQAKLLKAAHDLLVQAMVARSPQQATTPQPGVPQVVRPSVAPVSMQLKSAHDLLAQAMVTGSPQQATTPQPGVPQVARPGEAPVSMQQGLVECLNSRNPLSAWQMQIVKSAVERAMSSGALSLSAAQSESWAKGLMHRVQVSVRWPLDKLTESERETESADLKALCELIKQLGGQGYL